jgi:hypothetical protein
MAATAQSSQSRLTFPESRPLTIDTFDEWVGVFKLECGRRAALPGGNIVLLRNKFKFNDGAAVQWKLRGIVGVVDRAQTLLVYEAAALHMDAVLSPVPFKLHIGFDYQGTEARVQLMVGEATHVVTLRSFSRELQTFLGQRVMSNMRNYGIFERAASSTAHLQQRRSMASLSYVSSYESFLPVGTLYAGLDALEPACVSLPEYKLLMHA